MNKIIPLVYFFNLYSFADRITYLLARYQLFISKLVRSKGNLQYFN